MNDDITSAIREYIEGSDSLRRPGPLSDTTALGTGGVLDSIAIIELVLFLETRFGIQFTSRDLDRRRLETIERIGQLVAERQAARASGPQTDAPGA